MKKIRNLVIGGIENKVFNLILVAVFLTALAFMAGFLYQNKMLKDLSNESSQKQKEAIAETTGSIMDQVVTLSLNRNTVTESMLVDELFHGLQTRVEMLAQYAQKLYNDPESVSPAPFEGPDAARNGEITAQLILADGTEIDDALAERIGIAATMSDMMVSMFGASEETNSCFVALPEGAFLVVDDRSASKYSESGEPISYDPRTRPWYQQAVEEGKLIFTDVEVDAFTGDIGIVCAMPVYVDGELAAVVGSDLFLTSMQEGVQASDENGGFVCIVNQKGHVVFSPKTEGELKVVRSSEAADLRQSPNEELASLVEDALQGKTDVRLVNLQDGTYYMNGAPMKTVGWALISVFSQEVTDQPTKLMLDNYQQR